jgi:hypothetical protein
MYSDSNPFSTLTCVAPEASCDVTECILQFGESAGARRTI